MSDITERDNISRAELTAFTEAHSKAAVALEKVTDTLILITQKQDKLFDRMTNGVSECIVNGVNNNYDLIHKETVGLLNRIEGNQKLIMDGLGKEIPLMVDERLKNSEMARDIGKTKFVVTISSVIIIIVIVIMRLIGTAAEFKLNGDQMAALKKYVISNINNSVPETVTALDEGTKPRSQ